MLNTLLLYPDHPYGLGTLYGSEYDPELGRNVKFVIAETTDLPEDDIYPKERKLIEEIKCPTSADVGHSSDNERSRQRLG
jgi:hypothetical protein